MYYCMCYKDTRDIRMFNKDGTVFVPLKALGNVQIQSFIWVFFITYVKNSLSKPACHMKASL